MKKILIIFFVFVLIIATLSFPIAFAEDGREESETSKYFREVWLEKLITALTVFIGVISALAVSAYKIFKVLKESKTALSSLSQKEVDLNSVIEETQEAKKKAIELYERCENLIFDNQRFIDQEIKRSEDFSKELEIIKKILYLYVTNNSEMVKKGYARNVAEIAGYEKEE